MILGDHTNHPFRKTVVILRFSLSKSILSLFQSKIKLKIPYQFNPGFDSAGASKVSLVHLPDVICHLLVEAELFPFAVEVRLLAVAADKAVHAGSNVGRVQLFT